MEAAAASALTKEVVLKLVALLSEKHKLSKGLKDDLRFIRTELDMISSARDAHPMISSPRPQALVSMEEMRDLAHDIEDCIDRYLPCVACEGDASASVLRRVKTAVTSTTRSPRFAAEIRKLRVRLRDAHERRANYDVRAGGRLSSSPAAAAGAASPPAAAADGDLVGIDKPKQELVELLLESEPGRSGVISVVGFGGSGKTTLARAVFDCPGVVRRFPCRAWAAASEHRDTEGLLTAILRQFHTDPNSIDGLLRTTKCLIVIDDINKQHWDAIKSIFHRQTKCRIIVTTSLQSVANACSSGGGYVYKMGILDAELSKVLLMKKVFFQGCSPELERGSKAIVEKCDGLPLALVSVAKFLLGENELTGSHCMQVCRNLGLHMEKDEDFAKLQQVLVNNYMSLSGYPLRTSLLYTSLYPNGRPIRRNTLIRRWLAEGYMQCQYKRSDMEVAAENFRELVDRNIIQPIDASNNTKVKTCKTHGIMHEFMLHKSMSDNFITSLHDQNRSKFRHLFIQNPASGSTLVLNHQHTTPASVNVSGNEKFRARSLTVFGNVEESASEFCRCELLRVLDLQECNDLEDDHLKDIHKLWHLKYLSLGGTINNLPRNIEKLHCLETLDLRKTKIDILPYEVIGLPHLAHLLGKFKLGKKDLKMSELEKLLPKKCKLKTLAGFVADENAGFLQLMAHMNELKKVKIWCEFTGADSKSMAHISKAVQKYAQDGMDTTGVRSLSLDFRNSLGDFLGSIQEYCYLSSLKLRGMLSVLPQFVTSLCGLTELCLSSTNLVGNDLSNLCKLRYLLYLKMVEADLRSFVINNGDFPSLRRLCLVVQTPVLPTIRQGALPYLVSLQLLCKDLVDLSGIHIEYHDCLEEVALDSMVGTRTVEMWETAAKKHPKRPKVQFLKRIDPSETQSTVKYVATDGPIPKKGPSIEFSQVQLTRNMLQNECIIHSVQSSSVNKPSSALNKIIVSQPPQAASELSSAGNGAMPPAARFVA
uniref:NB-ARC domain-containing protein n=2 Tax=Hordeum vulgare subsp. vulgare TaxID=112509 RepID=A0A8I6YK99_HORVV